MHEERTPDLDVNASLSDTTPTVMDPLAICTKTLAEVVPERLQKPRIGIVCGSGLAGLATSLRDVVQIPYDQLAGFATSTGESTSARIRFAHGSSVAFDSAGPSECAGIWVAWIRRWCARRRHARTRTSLFIAILLTEVHEPGSSIPMRDTACRRWCSR